MDQTPRPDIPPGHEGWFSASLFGVAAVHFLVPASVGILADLMSDGENEISFALPLIMSVIGVLAYATLGTGLHAILKSGGSTSWFGYLAWGLVASMLVWHFFLSVISGGGAFYQPGDAAGQQIYLWGTAYVACLSLITAFIGWWFRYRWRAG